MYYPTGIAYRVIVQSELSQRLQRCVGDGTLNCTNTKKSGEFTSPHRK